MKKKEQGVLTVEATIVLMVFVMFVLFLYNFAGVYRAQSTVSHAAIEAADAVALESYLREVAFESDPQEVIYLASKLGGSATLDANALESLRTADLPKLARDKFIAAIATNESDADIKLKQLGVKDGLSGMSFSQCHADLDGDNIVVFVEYAVQFQFPVFGEREIRVTKAAKAKTFGDILYSVSTSSNNPDWGSTAGDNRVDHGAYVEISATPNFGYRFVKWDDGNTDNPRRVLVTDVSKYKAIFEPTNMGVNLYLKKTSGGAKYRWDENQEYGTVTGAGNYTYMEAVTISATAKQHYHFIGWDDDGNGTVDSKENPRQIIVDETHNITAIYQAEEYTITVNSNNESYGSARVYSGTKEGKSVTAEYGSKVKIVASAEPTYRLKRWSNNVAEYQQVVEVRGNASYTAIFERATCKVNFYVNDQLYSTQEVVIGSSVDGSNGTTGAVMPKSPQLDKQLFTGWQYNNKAFTSTTKVSNDIRVDAQFVSPSVTLSGGNTGTNTTTFTAKTKPENVKLSWSSSNTKIATVNQNGKVTVNKSGKVTITAYFVLNGSRYEDSVSIQIGESEHEVVYCMNMANNGRRYYTKNHISLRKQSKWGVTFPGTNHHCYSTGCCGSHARKIVKYSVLDNSKIVSAASNVVHRVGTYSGYNKSGEQGYVFDNGSGNAIYFETKQTSSGPRGYFIQTITH